MKQAKLILFSVILFFTIASCSAGDANLKIHFIDAGEGDSILIQTSQNKAILIDAGNFITGFKVAEYLKKHRIKKLERLIFTHYDMDHIGGAFFILQMLDAKSVFDNGQDLSEAIQRSDIYRWYEELARKRPGYSSITRGNSFTVDGVALKVLWPQRPILLTDFNANSLVMMLEFKNFKCLLTGDILIAGEEELLKSKEGLKADILKVGHHGQDDATSKEFLRAVSPQVSIISVGKDDIRGRPSPETIKNLKDFGSAVYRTDEVKNIIITVNKNGAFTISHE